MQTVRLPLFYFKKNWTDDWVVGEQDVRFKMYETEGCRLYYTYLWVVLHAGILGVNGQCCLGPVAGALRHGIATLHPRTPQYMQFFDLLNWVWVDGMYTLRSGWIRPW